MRSNVEKIEGSRDSLEPGGSGSCFGSGSDGGDGIQSLGHGLGALHPDLARPHVRVVGRDHRQGVIAQRVQEIAHRLADERCGSVRAEVRVALPAELDQLLESAPLVLGEGVAGAEHELDVDRSSAHEQADGSVPGALPRGIDQDLVAVVARGVLLEKRREGEVRPAARDRRAVQEEERRFVPAGFDREGETLTVGNDRERFHGHGRFLADEEEIRESDCTVREGTVERRDEELAGHGSPFGGGGGTKNYCHAAIDGETMAFSPWNVNPERGGEWSRMRAVLFGGPHHATATAISSAPESDPTQTDWLDPFRHLPALHGAWLFLD